MSSPVPPNDALKDYCRICESPASGHKNHGAICCYSCRIFFRRVKGRTYKCKKGTGECNILGNLRIKCKKCRFDKCLLVGMDASNVDTYVRIIPFNKEAPNSENVESLIQKHDTKKKKTLQPKNVDITGAIKQTYVHQEIITFNVDDAVIEQYPQNDEFGKDKVSLLEHPSQHDEISLLPVSNVLENFINEETKPQKQDINMIEDSLSPTTIKEQNVDIEGMLLELSENSWIIDHTAEDEKTITILNDSPPFLPNVSSDKRKLSYSTEEVSDETQSTIMDQILPIKKQPRMQQMPYPVSTVIDRRIVPVVKFTVEEEFYFHEIEAKKSYFYDSMLDSSKQTNYDQKCVKFMHEMVESISKNQSIFCEKPLFDEELKMLQDIFLREKNILLPQLSKCGSTFISSMVNNTKRSFSLLEFIPYYSIKEMSYVEQMKKAGQWTRKMQTWIEENTPQALTLRSVHVREFESLVSPWAVNLEDEEYFNRIMKKLVEVINEDTRLRILFSFFVLVSPVSSMQMFEIDDLTGLRRNMLMMMYRYLASKDGFDWRTASEIVERLQGLIPRLYNAGQIFYNRRIPSCHPDDIPSFF